MAIAPNSLFIRWEPEASMSGKTLNITLDDQTVADVSADLGFYELKGYSANRNSVIGLAFVNDQNQQSAKLRLPYGTGLTGIFGLRADVYSDNALEIFWSSRPTTFHIWRNDQLLDTVEGNSYFDDSVEPNTEYSYRVTETVTSDQFAVLDHAHYTYEYSDCGPYDYFSNRDVIAMQVLPTSSDSLTVSTGLEQRSFAVDDTVEGLSCSYTLPIPNVTDAVVYSQTTLELFWDRVTFDGYIEYQVFRNYELLGTTDGTSFLDTAIEPGDSYEYQVVAIDRQNDVQSEPGYFYENIEPEHGSTDSTDSVDVKPENLNAQVYSSTALELFWERNYMFDESAIFEIYRDGELLESINGTSYFDSNLVPGQGYNYEVVAYAYGFISETASINLQTNNEPSSGSNDVSSTQEISNIVGQVYSSSALEIFWDRVEIGEGPSIYSVYRDNELLGTTEGNSYFDSALNASTPYEYYVTIGSVGDLAATSATLSLTTNP